MERWKREHHVWLLLEPNISINSGKAMLPFWTICGNCAVCLVTYYYCYFMSWKNMLFQQNSLYQLWIWPLHEYKILYLFTSLWLMKSYGPNLSNHFFLWFSIKSWFCVKWLKKGQKNNFRQIYPPIWTFKLQCAYKFYWKRIVSIYLHDVYGLF